MAAIKAWDGLDWVLKTVRAWNGTDFTTGAGQYYWDGFDWIALGGGSAGIVRSWGNELVAVDTGASITATTFYITETPGFEQLWEHKIYVVPKTWGDTATMGEAVSKVDKIYQPWGETLTPVDGTAYISAETRYITETPGFSQLWEHFVTREPKTWGESVVPSETVSKSDRTPPAAPTVTATLGFEKITVEATSSGATSYDLYLDQWNSGTSQWDQVQSALNDSDGAITWVRSGDDGAQYRGRAVAKNDLGSSSEGTSTSVTVDLPDTPTGMDATGTSATNIDMSWFAATGATGYQWEAASTGSTTGNTATTATDTGGTIDSSYACRVRGKNDHGYGGWSASETAYTKPNTPSVSASVVSDSRIDVTVTDNSAISNSFNVYRDNALWLSNVAAGTHSDTGLTASTQYCYHAVCLNPEGSNHSDASTSVCKTTNATPPELTNVSVSVDALKNDHNVRWDQNANTKSVLVEYQYRDSNDVALGWQTHASSPSETDGAASVTFATVDGDASIEGYDVQYRVTPYSGDALGGTAGTAVTTAWAGPF